MLNGSFAICHHCKTGHRKKEKIIQYSATGDPALTSGWDSILFLSTSEFSKNTFDDFHPPLGSPSGLYLHKWQFAVTDNRWHQIFLPGHRRPLCSTVSAVHLCQKWTGGHREVPLVKGRGPASRLFQREGEGGFCF